MREGNVHQFTFSSTCNTPILISNKCGRSKELYLTDAEREHKKNEFRMETKWDVKELYDFNMDPLNHITGNDLLNSLVQETMGIPLKSNLFLQILCDFR